MRIGRLSLGVIVVLVVADLAAAVWLWRLWADRAAEARSWTSARAEGAPGARSMAGQRPALAGKCIPGQTAAGACP